MSALPERSESGVAAEGAGSSSSLESSDGLGALKGAGAVRAVSTTAGGAAAAAPSAAGEKERMEKPSALSRVFNPPKLER